MNPCAIEIAVEDCRAEVFSFDQYGATFAGPLWAGVHTYAMASSDS